MSDEKEQDKIFKAEIKKLQAIKMSPREIEEFIRNWDKAKID